MPYADKNKQQEFQRLHYKKYKDRFVQRTRDRRKANRLYVNEYKKSNICVKCGTSNYLVLDFHHVNPSDKTKEISELVKQSNIKKIKEEIIKCQLLCANCHRIEHYKHDTIRCDYKNQIHDSVKQIKIEAGCKCCGIKDYRVLEFHHTDSSTKIATVATLCRKVKKCDVELVFDEIAKCDVVCANCHRVLHNAN